MSAQLILTDGTVWPREMAPVEVQSFDPPRVTVVCYWPPEAWRVEPEYLTSDESRWRSWELRVRRWAHRELRPTIDGLDRQDVHITDVVLLDNDVAIWRDPVSPITLLRSIDSFRVAWTLNLAEQLAPVVTPW